MFDSNVNGDAYDRAQCKIKSFFVGKYGLFLLSINPLLQNRNVKLWLFWQVCLRRLDSGLSLF